MKDYITILKEFVRQVEEEELENLNEHELAEAISKALNFLDD